MFSTRWRHLLDEMLDEELEHVPVALWDASELRPERDETLSAVADARSVHQIVREAERDQRLRQVTEELLQRRRHGVHRDVKRPDV